MKSIELRNQIIAMLYQNMNGFEADVTLELVDRYSEDRPLESYDISIRALNVLRSCNINSIYDLKDKSVEELLSYRTMTKKTVEELIDLKLITI